MTQRSSSRDNASDEDLSMSGEIKAAYVFNKTVCEDEEKRPSVQPARVIQDEDSVQIIEMQTEDDTWQPNVSEQPKQTSSRKWLILLFIAVVTASIAELSLFFYSVIHNMDWLGGLWLVILLVFILLGCRVVLLEYKGLKQLRQQNDMRHQSESLADSVVIGLAEQHCLDVAKRLPDNCQVLVSQWRDSYDSHHSDSEILALFEHKVLAPIDKLAMKKVSSNASAASVMIAVSPFALLDMLIVLWRNVNMMDQVSQVYGLQLGYFSRIKLIRKIFHAMVYAGAGEILSDAGNYALGAGVTGKLSTRVAQGLGAGVLTARIGLKALNESRPLPWRAEKKPSLAAISKQLLTNLSQQVR